MLRIETIPQRIIDSNRVKHGTLSYWTLEEWWKKFYWGGYFGIRQQGEYQRRKALKFWCILDESNYEYFVDWYSIDEDLLIQHPFLISCDQDIFPSFIPKKYVEGQEILLLFDEVRNQHYSLKVEKIEGPDTWPFEW